MKPGIQFSLTLLLLTIFSTQGFSGQFKVRKVKGNQAIIETTIPLTEGEVYDILPQRIAIDPFDSKRYQSRSRLMNIGLDASFLKGTETQENLIRLWGKYGWNFETFEIGPEINFESSDVGAGTNRLILLGAFFNYNFNRNISPQNWVYGATTSGGLGEYQFSNGGSTRLMQFEGGVFSQYFIHEQTTALRGDLTLFIRQLTTTTSETQLTGARVKGSLVLYF